MLAAHIEADRFLAAVVNREINALAAHKWGICACFLATDAFDFDHLCAEVREHHAAARTCLKTRQLQHAHAVETELHDRLANTHDTLALKRYDTRCLWSSQRLVALNECSPTDPYKTSGDANAPVFALTRPNHTLSPLASIATQQPCMDHRFDLFVTAPS